MEETVNYFSWWTDLSYICRWSRSIYLCIGVSLSLTEQNNAWSRCAPGRGPIYSLSTGRALVFLWTCTSLEHAFKGKNTKWIVLAAAKQQTNSFLLKAFHAIFWQKSVHFTNVDNFDSPFRYFKISGTVWLYEGNDVCFGILCLTRPVQSKKASMASQVLIPCEILSDLGYRLFASEKYEHLVQILTSHRKKNLMLLHFTSDDTILLFTVEYLINYSDAVRKINSYL